MKMDINFILFYFTKKGEFYPMIYYLIQIINEIQPYKLTFIHMKSFIYGHIHQCRWIKITLNFKFQA
jgi:hypothetical protein